METSTHPSGDNYSIVEVWQALGPKGKGFESGKLEYLCSMGLGQPGVLEFHLQLVMMSRVRKHRGAWLKADDPTFRYTRRFPARAPSHPRVFSYKEAHYPPQKSP